MTRWEPTPCLPWEAYERVNVLILRARTRMAAAGVVGLLAWLVWP